MLIRKVDLHSSSLSRLLRTFTLFLLILLQGGTNTAQNTTVDSLRIELSKTSSDSIRLVDQLIKELINVDLDQALTLAQCTLELSQEKNDKESEAIALHNIGLALYETKDRSSSINYFEKSAQLADELKLRELQSLSLMRIAKYHRYVNHDSTLTVKYLLQSADVSTAADEYWCAGRSYAKLASFYTRYNEIELIEEYMELAAKYYRNIDSANETTAHYYNEVGEKIWATNPKKSMDFYFEGMKYSETPNLMVSLAKAYGYTGENEVAIVYLNKAIPLLRELRDQKRMLGVALSQLSVAYIELGDYEAANIACDEGIALLTPIGRSSQKAIPSLYRTKGIIEEHHGDDESALEYYTTSLEEAARIKYGFEKIKATLTLGQYYSFRDSEKGKKYCKRALKQAKSKQHTNLEIKACECLYDIYSEENSYEKALSFHIQKTALNDSLSTTKIEYAFDVNTKLKEKDKLIAEQSLQKELREKELNTQYILNRYLALSILLGSLLIGFLAMGYLRIKKQNDEIKFKTDELVNANMSLEKSNKELERFAHITSHDLKTPIRSILSFSGLLRSKIKPEPDSSINNYLTFIESSGKRMKQLIEDILEFSQLSGNTALEKETVDLNMMVKELSHLVQTATNSENIKIDVISSLPQLKWYYSKMFLLFKNLIENGIKYNNSGSPTITISCEKISGVCKIYIEDNGIGIEKKYFDHIFVMFNRLHNQEQFEGTGLGLATCKKIVEEFEGKISIDSEVSMGTKFTLEIPDVLIADGQMKHISNPSTVLVT